MLTIFSIPKAFSGDADRLQRNALESWLRLDGVQVILCGDDAGVTDVAREYGCEHEPMLRRTELGTPRLDDAFAAAERRAVHELLCYTNADIILLDGFLRALQLLSKVPAFVAVGLRTDVWLESRINFEAASWQADLLELVQREGKRARPVGSDYFIFRRGTLGTLPPFAVGRPFWDNWLMFRARQLGWPLIDATEAIMAVHQNHDYGHVPQAAGGMWTGPEGDENLRLAGGRRGLYKLIDATHALESTGMRPLNDWKHRLWRARRRLEKLPGWELARSVYHSTRKR